MIRVTVEEADENGRLLAKHTAEDMIEREDCRDFAALLAQCVGGVMYHSKVAAEAPLLLAAANTHRASFCVRAIARARETGGVDFAKAVKISVAIDQLVGEDRSARFRDREAQIFRLLDAEIR